jgi:nucleoside-diphosphate kinase
LRQMKLFTIDNELAQRHYTEHRDKPFFDELVSFITSGPVVAMVVEGPDAVLGMRQVMGATNPLDASPGSIRGDFATLIGENIVHGSDSPESATREISLFFPDL